MNFTDKPVHRIDVHFSTAKWIKTHLEEQIELLESSTDKTERTNIEKYIGHCENDYAIACKNLFEQMLFLGAWENAKGLIAD